MMLRHLGWFEAADLILKGMNGAIQAKTVTYDFARLMKGARQVSCSAFGDAMIRHMGGPAASARRAPVAKKGARRVAKATAARKAKPRRNAKSAVKGKKARRR
jgi:hypothetical protein